MNPCKHDKQAFDFCFLLQYYTCPISEYTFCSKEEVIHYLNIVAAASHASVDTECFGDEDQQVRVPLFK